MNVIHKLLLGMILFAFVNCSSSSKKVADKSEIYYGAGTQFLVDQKYTEALSNLLKAHELDPKNPNILNNLGMAYYFKEQTESAFKCFVMALKIDPNHTDSKANIASLYFKQGKIEKAEKVYREVLKDLVYDKQARTYYNLGLISLQRKNYSQAREFLERSVKEDENYCPASFQLGLLSFGSKNYKKAYSQFRDASMGTCYNNPVPHFYIGLTLIELKKYLDARMKFDEISDRFPKSEYSAKARLKMVEINELEKQHNTEFSEYSITPNSTGI